jgi:hypothetical protein
VPQACGKAGEKAVAKLWEVVLRRSQLKGIMAINRAINGIGKPYKTSFAQHVKKVFDNGSDASVRNNALPNLCVEFFIVDVGVEALGQPGKDLERKRVSKKTGFPLKS